MHYYIECSYPQVARAFVNIHLSTGTRCHFQTFSLIHSQSNENFHTCYGFYLDGCENSRKRPCVRIVLVPNHFNVQDMFRMNCM